MSQSIGEIIQLIESLYQPNPPANFNEIQQHLQSFQKDEKIGMELAKELLSLEKNYSTQCKYFGALTYTVQVNHYLSKNSNSETAILDDDKISTSEDGVSDFLKVLLLENLNFLIQYVDLYIKGLNVENFVVIKKMMSNLSLLFININKDLIDLITPPGGSKKSTGWKNPINSLINGIFNKNDGELSYDTILQFLNQEIPYDRLIAFLKFSKYSNRILISFLSILVEEIMKTGSTRILPFQLSNVYHIIHDNVYVTGLSIFMENLQQRILITSPSEATSGNYELLNDYAFTDELLFESLISWFQYSQTIPQVSGQTIDLTELFVKLIELMCNDSVNFRYSSEIVNIFYHLHDINSLVVLNYETRCRLEKQLFPTALINIEVKNPNWIMEYMNYLITNELFENDLKTLALLMPNVLSNSMTKTCNELFLLENRSNVQIQEHIKMLIQFTNFPLVPIIQENFSIQMLNFWCDLAEVFISLNDHGNDRYDQDFAIELFQQCVEIYIPKFSLSNKEKILQEVAETGDTQLALEFDDFRKIGTEFIDQIWSIMGHTHLTNRIMDLSLKNNGDIYQLEVCSLILQQLFDGTNFSQSPMLSDSLAQENNKIIAQNISMLELGLTHPVLKIDFIKTSTSFLCTVASFFNINDNKKEILSHCIDVLFKTLSDMQNSTEETEFLICKTLTTLCETCRFQLNSYLDSFMDILQTMLQPTDSSRTSTSSNGIKISSLSREKFSGSCGSIITSFDKNSIKDTTKFQKLGDIQKMYIDKFLNIVIECMEKSASFFQMEQDMSDYVVSLLKCIYSFNQGLLIFNDDDEDDSSSHVHNTLSFFSYSAPPTSSSSVGLDGTTTIDLSNVSDDDDDENGQNSTSNNALNPMIYQYQQFMIHYWSPSSKNSEILIDKMLHILKTLIFSKFQSISNNNIKMIEQADLIISQYLTTDPQQQQPFPFKFEIPQIMDFVNMIFTQCPFEKCFQFNIKVLTKMGSHMCAMKIMEKQEFDYILNNFIVKYYYDLILSDPDYIQNCIEFVNFFLEKSPRLIIQSEFFQPFILNEFLKLLVVIKEKFTIIPLSKFWIKLINNKKYDQECVLYINELFHSPTTDSLGYKLIKNCFIIILNSNRSEVMQYSDIIRTLVSKQPLNCKKWLQQCLLQDYEVSQLLGQSSSSAGGVNHAQFIEKLMCTNGSKRACLVINDWYLQCTGLPHY